MGSPPPVRADDRDGVRERLRSSMISGLAITVPVLVTLFVFDFAMNLLLDSVGPLAELLQMLGISGRYAPDVAALVTLLAFVLLVGFATEHSRLSRRLEQAFTQALSSVPGIGTVYRSFDEMSQLLIDKDTQSFQEVKLVEYPVEQSYCVAFVTADTSQNIRDATDNTDMTTLYLPMAPNPVMGGFVIHVADEKVYDIDMSVEEGMRSVVTSGVAVNTTGEKSVEEPPPGTEGGFLPDVREGSEGKV